MEKFIKHTGIAAALPILNVDTDMIIPKQYLKTIKRTGLGKHLFDEMRYFKDGSENPDFVLNENLWRKSSILIAGDNFGCGSSREHAPWALLDFGIRCVIAPSFADIFYNNCFKNGILPIRLEQEKVDTLFAHAASDTPELTVDLESLKISTSSGLDYDFYIDEFHRNCLLNGLDDIGLTLKEEDKIQEFEDSLSKDKPWILAGTKN